MPAASSAWAVERLSREKRGARRKARAPGAARGSHPRPGGSRGVLRAAGGGVPHSAAAAAALAFRAAPPPAAERAAPARGLGREVARPPRRVAVSSSTSGAPAGAEGEGCGSKAASPLPADRIAICDPAGLGGGSAPAGRCPRGAVPVSRGDGRRENERHESKAAQRSRLLARGGAGRAGRRGRWRAALLGTSAAGPAPGAWFAAAAAAAGAVAAMPPPSRPRRRSRGSERPKSRGGQGWQGVPAGRACVRARARAAGGGYLVDPASSICLSQSLSHACLSTHGRYSETANGSLNQLWFLWSLLSRSLDNCGNSRANTCRRAPTSGDACIYQTKTNPGPPGSFGDSR